MRVEPAVASLLLLWAGGCRPAAPETIICNGASTCGPQIRAAASPTVLAEAPGPPIEAMFMGDPQHSGRSPFRGPQRTPTVAWRILTGGRILASPLIDRDGNIIVCATDGSVRALRPDGTEIFQRNLGAPIRATPVIAADGSIWIGTGAGDLVVLDDAGNERARHALGAPVYAALTIGPGGTVLVAADGIHGFAPDTTRRFHHPTADRVHSAPAVHPDGFFVFGTLHGRLRAITPEGDLHWEVHAGAAIEAAPTIGDDGTIVVGNVLGRILGYGPDGTERFRYEPEDEHAVLASAALTRSGALAIGRHDGSLHLLDRQGHPLKTFTTAGPIQASARVDAEGTLFVGSRDDTFHAFSEDGETRWRYNLGQDIDAPAAIGADGTLYVGTDHGALYALRDSP